MIPTHPSPRNRAIPGKTSLRLMLVVALMLATGVAAMPVEVTHPVAPFLRRLEEKGLTAPGFWSTLPRDSRAVLAALSQAAQNEKRLSAWDRRRVEHYLNEFDPTRRSVSTRLHYVDSLFRVFASAEYFTSGYLGDSIPAIDGYTFGSFSPGVEGFYGKNIYFDASATVSMERHGNSRSQGHYQPSQGLPYGTARKGFQGGVPQGVSTFDGFRIVIGFGDPRLALEAGQDWNQWGPGHWQHASLGARPWFWVQDSLAASPPGSATEYPGNADFFQGYRRGYRYPGEGPPLPQLRFRMSGHRWEYTKIVAERTGLTPQSSAYLVAHRLQARLGTWTFGAAEMMAIGSHGMDGIVLLPGVPLKFAEHAASDQANSAISADIEWIWKGHGRVYGELFVDDFSGPPLNFWGNKFAWTLGAAWQDPFGLPSELHLEYARVDPWVYGHHLYDTQMQSYGALLGSGLPPNSHGVFASVTFPLQGNMDAVVEWRFRQRDVKSLGSSIFDDYYSDIRTPPPKENYKQFLALDVEARNELSASAEWTWMRHARIRGGAGGLWVNNYRGQPGVSMTTPILFGEVRLQY